MRFCILGRIGKQRWGGRPPRRVQQTVPTATLRLSTLGGLSALSMCNCGAGGGLEGLLRVTSKVRSPRRRTAPSSADGSAQVRFEEIFQVRLVDVETRSFRTAER